MEELSKWQKFVVGAMTFLVLLSLISIPLTYLFESHRAAIQDKENAQTLAHIENTEAGIQQLLNFVASVQSHSASGSEEQKWYVAEMEAICASLPHCVSAPLPTALK